MNLRLTLSLAVSILAAASPIARAADSLRVTVDARIELLYAIESQTDRPMLTWVESSYKSETRQWFAPWRDHEAVKLFHEVWRTIDLPPHVMLCVSPPPELKPRMDLAECAPDVRERQPEIAKWLELARDFGVKSRFDEYFKAHQAFYDRTVAAFRKLIVADYTTPLETYYGRKQHSYSFVLALLLPGNVGLRIPASDGLDIYSVLGPMGLRDGIPSYGSTESLRGMIWHEFGHSFSNPVVIRHKEAWEPYSALLEPLREAMGRQAYRQWSSCVIEHVNRAHVARITKRELGDAAAEAVLAEEERRGFRYIRPLYKRLDEYEAAQQVPLNGRLRHPASVRLPGGRRIVRSGQPAAVTSSDELPKDPKEAARQRNRRRQGQQLRRGHTGRQHMPRAGPQSDLSTPRIVGCGSRECV